MQILKSVDQINDVLDSIFSKENVFLQKKNLFISEIMSDLDVESIFANTGNIADKRNDIEELSGLIFQLKDYIPALCNFTKILLFTKNYEALVFFVCRLFVSHVGVVHYQSTLNKYSLSERFFDRFIEIVKNCNIAEQIYLPFLISIVQSDSDQILALWAKPAREYLQKYFFENENLVKNFLETNVNIKYDFIKAILDFNTVRGIKILFEDFARGKDVNVDRVELLIKMYKRDVLQYIDKEITNADEDKKKLFIDILFLFENDLEVVARLTSIHETDNNPNIKIKIASKIGFAETLSIRSEKMFLYSTRRLIKEPQERSLGVPFEKMPLHFRSGQEADNSAKTFLLHLFKQEQNLFNLIKLDVMKEIFDNTELSNFAYQIFMSLSRKVDINQAKWCVRMTSLVCQGQDLNNICDFLVELYKQRRIKEAKYFTEALIYSKRIEVVDVFKRLKSIDNSLFNDWGDNYIALFSDYSKIDENDIKDRLVPDNYSDDIYEQEKSRLYYGFISGRMFTPKTFSETFLEKPVFNRLAQHLVFGEYVQGKLYNAFVIEDKSIRFVYGKELQDDTKLFSIVHNLDLDVRFEGIEHIIKDPTFDQFKPSRFNVAEFSRSALSVNRFCGMLVNLNIFFKGMQEQGFIANRQEGERFYNSLIHIMPNLNLVAEVLFEKPVNDDTEFATLGMIHFIRFADCLTVNGGFITSKENSVSVGAVPYRYFDFILNAVFQNGKK